MGKEIIYRCDKAGCKLTRPAISETNHWFIVGPKIGEGGIGIYPFSLADYYEDKDKIFCGEAHTLEYIGTELPKLFPRVSEASRESDMDQLNPIDEHYENITKEEENWHRERKIPIL